MTYQGFMNCIRCGKRIDHPDASNADYIIASDTVVREPVNVLIAVKHNQATLAKGAKMKETETAVIDGTPTTKLKYPDLKIDESEYAHVEVASIKVAERDFGEDLVKIKAEVKEKDIQKTGMICPGCHRPTDQVIWGVHKGGR